MSIFREYDIRGIYEKDLNKDIVFSIGKNLAIELKNRGGRNIAIGYDARTHSEELFTWLSHGIATENIDIYFMGMVPTPVAYFSLYCKFKNIDIIDASIMITGSHNPPQYNGFKITMLKQPFYGSDIRKIGELVSNKVYTFKEVDRNIKEINALDEYVIFMTKHFDKLKKMTHKIAIDCGNGVAGLAISRILENLGIEFLGLYTTPDGNFPNHHPDPSEEKNLTDLKRAMQESDIKIGIAFDGDADRLALISKDYAFKGDELAILFAKKMLDDGLKPVVIGEVKCSSIMYDEINKIGKSIMYKTGHSNLKVKLKETNAHLAAEMSGHMFFNDRYFGYDDAIYASLRSLELFLESSIDDIQNIILNLPKMYSTPEEKVQSSEERKFKIIESLSQKLQNPPPDFPTIKDIVKIDGLRVVFDDGWGLIRASNTTPVLVTRFEAKTKQLADFYKKKMLELLDN